MGAGSAPASRGTAPGSIALRKAGADPERVLDSRLPHDLRPGSAAGAAGLFLRPQARGEDRRDRGVVGGLGAAGPSGRSAGEGITPSRPGCVTPAAWHPRRLVRTVLGSIAASTDFGKQMAREAQRRRFAEAPAKAFLGDGLAWNWSIWKPHVPDFTPILDFIHVLSYLFLAATAVPDVASDAWDQYLVWMRGARQGEVAQVLEELRAWQTRRGYRFEPMSQMSYTESAIRGPYP